MSDSADVVGGSAFFLCVERNREKRIMSMQIKRTHTPKKKNDFPGVLER